MCVSNSDPSLPTIRPPAWAAFFWLLLGAPPLLAQLGWLEDVHLVRELARSQGRAVLVLSGGTDPYFTAETGDLLAEWTARAYLPLRLTTTEGWEHLGARLKTPPPLAPALVVLNPLLEERSRHQGPLSWLELREFLRTWTTVPLLSAVPLQAFRGPRTLIGDGEGGWHFLDDPQRSWFEHSRAGPYVILREPSSGAEFALPLEGAWAFYRPPESEVWERAFPGVLDASRALW